MIFSISHTTRYRYDAPISFCHNLATIRPRISPGQKVLNFDLKISPEPSDISERTDFFGNMITHFSIQESHQKLTVASTSTVERNYKAIKDSFASEACRKITVNDALQVLATTNTQEIIESKQFILDSILIRNTNEAIGDYAKVSFSPNRSVFDATYELMQRIYTDFDFVSGFTTVSTPLTEVMEEKKGVCQDFAQIAIACIRSMGLPARYVSGYIETLPPPGKKKLIGVDASHAWFAVFIPNFGWVDFDPTNNQIPEDQHIVVGWGRDYYDVPPLKGVVFGSGSSTLKVSVDIRPAEEAKNLKIVL